MKKLWITLIIGLVIILSTLSCNSIWYQYKPGGNIIAEVISVEENKFRDPFITLSNGEEYYILLGDINDPKPEVGKIYNFSILGGPNHRKFLETWEEVI